MTKSLDITAKITDNRMGVYRQGLTMIEFSNKKPNFEHAEQQAWNMLTKYKIYQPPVVAAIIAEQEGLKVKITLLKSEYRQTIAGLIDPTSRTIIVNAEDPVSRRNFTVAHELGHFVLEHDIESPAYRILYRNSEKQINKDSIEQEADAFAANLLVPLSMLRECLETYPFATNQQLAQFFGVSMEVIKWRRKRA